MYENNENELLRLISAEGFFKYDYQRMGGCTKRNINCDNNIPNFIKKIAQSDNGSKLNIVINKKYW